MSLWRAEVLVQPGNQNPLPLLSYFAPRLPVEWNNAVGVAALREFFAVSPVWLRGATALATLLLCVLGALFVARMLKPSQQLYTQQELNARVAMLVEQRTKEKESAAALLNKEATQGRQPENSPRVLEASAHEPQTPAVKARSMPRSSRRSLSRAEREQLAADLGLKPGTDEDDISFLLDGGSN